MGLAGDLLKNLEFEIGKLILVPSDGGRFEVTVNRNLLYSKLETNRHAEPGEVLALIQEFITREATDG